LGRVGLALFGPGLAHWKAWVVQSSLPRTIRNPDFKHADDRGTKRDRRTAHNGRDGKYEIFPQGNSGTLVFGGQVCKKTGKYHTTSPTALRFQDERTALLRTLGIAIGSFIIIPPSTSLFGFLVLIGPFSSVVLPLP